MITMPVGSSHSDPVVGLALLVELAFTAGTLRLTTSPTDILAGGYNWLGLGALGSVDQMSESADQGTEQVTLTLSIASQALVAAAMGDPATYRGKPVRISLIFMSEAWQPLSEPRQRWTGVMNKVSIRREAGGSGSSSGAIELHCMRRGMDRARNAEGLRMTYAQHIAQFPGDTGLRYVRPLIEKPALWLTKKFQER